MTQEALVWINNRRDEIYKTRSELIDQRCYASLMFVKQLKETDEALDVVNWLKEDVLGVISGSVELAQVKKSATKLSMYTHIFN